MMQAGYTVRVTLAFLSDDTVSLTDVREGPSYDIIEPSLPVRGLPEAWGDTTVQPIGAVTLDTLCQCWAQR
jgi:hypothetical protein